MSEFETETCSRCGGSGHYSRCQMYGTTCFKCHGKGRAYTSRALKALEWIKQQRKIDISEVKIGDRVFVAGVGKFTVRSFETEGGCRYLKDGERLNMTTIRGEKLGYSGAPRQTDIQIIPPTEIAREQIAKAIELQNSLPTRKTRGSK